MISETFLNSLICEQSTKDNKSTLKKLTFLFDNYTKLITIAGEKHRSIENSPPTIQVKHLKSHLGLFQPEYKII